MENRVIFNFLFSIMPGMTNRNISLESALFLSMFLLIIKLYTFSCTRNKTEHEREENKAGIFFFSMTAYTEATCKGKHGLQTPVYEP